jgi:DNA processing protein
MQEDLIYEIALSKIDGIGGVMFKQLLNTFGSAKEVFETPTAKLMKVPNFGKISFQKLKDNKEAFEEAEQIVKESAKKNIRIVSFKNEEYPKKLKNIFEAPPIIYMKGKGHLDFPKSLAIVGTRDASEYGKKSTEEIVSQLKEHNVQIVSGLAYGIDIAAHKAALKNGLSTVAVLANSLESVYPTIHKKTAAEIEETGLLISEQPFGTLTKPSFFVARNRIIAALSDATIVVESARKGGSMVTAEYANNYNKEVFAIPGGIFQKYSEGPNYLVSNNKAQIFTSVADFVEWMKWDSENQTAKVEVKETIDLSKFTQEESKILSLLMQNGDMIIDDLSWHSQIHLNKLASILLNLEFQDLVKQSPGKKFGLK